MAQKRFGPTRGAGVVVIEKEAERILEAAPLGVTAYVGVLEKGPTDELISCYSKSQFTRRCGGRIAASKLPDCCQDFWDHAGGNGELHLVRVTDGNERQASTTLWSRETMGDNDQVTNGLKGQKLPVATIKAKNGGRWGGQQLTIIGEWTTVVDNVVTTALTLKKDELKGATFKASSVTNKTYTVVGNTASATSVITLKSNEDLQADHGVSSDHTYMITLDRDVDKEVSVKIGNGENDPANEWSMDVYVDGLVVLKYPNLSLDPDSENYFVNIINDDAGNWEIEVVDLASPGFTTPPEKRPACGFGAVSAATATAVTIRPLQWRHHTGCTGDETPIVTLGTLTQAMKYPDQLRVVFGAGTPLTISVYSEVLGKGVLVATGTMTTGIITYTGAWTRLPPLTFTQGATAVVAADQLLLDWHPLEPDALKGGRLWPDYLAEPNKSYYIKTNTITDITIASGDMTGVSTAGDLWLATYPVHLMNGYDGDAPATSDYVDAYAPDATLFRPLKRMNKGLVKLATPDVTDESVIAAGVNLAGLMNWQYRCEIPDDIVDEQSAIEQINDTVGRNDYLVTSWPSYGNVNDPDKSGQLKLIPLTGAIHGREALFANNYGGYHKAAAGIDFVLSRVVSLPIEEIDDEQINPQGINPVKIIQGNCIVWGDRTCALDPAWKWKHQREAMSHYECRLAEGFDWIVFAINDGATQAQLVTTLRAFFMPEWTNGALRGATFDDACSIKVDNEINTDATRAAGELYAEILLRLADTIERLIIRVGKMGIFDDVV